MKKSAAFLMLSMLGLLAACGFSPIYGSHGGADGPVNEQLASVAIDNIPDQKGQMLRNDLIDRLYGKGRPQQPDYRLSVKINEQREDTGTLSNATATLTELTMVGDFTLTDASGKLLLKGTSRSATTFSRLDDELATLSAQQSAEQRTLEEVSNQIVSRLSLYFAHPSPLPPQPANPHPVPQVDKDNSAKWTQ